MYSAKVHLPPIQDILHRHLSLLKTDKNNVVSFQPPISPVSPIASHRDQLYLPIRHEGHRINEPPQQDSNTPIKKNSIWEQWSVDNGFNGYTNHMEMDSAHSQKYGGSSDQPLYQQQKQIQLQSRSYPDLFLQGNSRRSSASENVTKRYSVDPPHVAHGRTASDLPLNRYKCSQCHKTFSRPSSLRIHILSHTGEKPHLCPQPGCGRRFSVQSNMRRHLRVHYCNPKQQHQQQQQKFQHQSFTRHLE